MTASSGHRIRAIAGWAGNRMAENAAENEDRQNHRPNHWPAAGAKIVMAMGRAPETSSGGRV